jgi:hypothetical protein
MEKLNLWVMGAALAITFVAVYALCALAFAIAPVTTIDFFNAWFHGLNLAGLQVGAKPFTFGVFLYGVAGIAVVAFVCGVVFATSYNLLRRSTRGG